MSTAKNRANEQSVPVGKSEPHLGHTRRCLRMITKMVSTTVTALMTS